MRRRPAAPTGGRSSAGARLPVCGGDDIHLNTALRKETLLGALVKELQQYDFSVGTGWTPAKKAGRRIAGDPVDSRAGKALQRQEHGRSRAVRYALEAGRFRV